MPCYEVRLVSVEFKAAHRDLLLKALKELGWAYRGNEQLMFIAGGIELDLVGEKARYPQQLAGKVNELKRKYSEVVVKEKAKKFGFSVKATSKGKFQLRRWS